MSEPIFTPAELANFREGLRRRKQRLLACLRSQRVVDASMISLVGYTAERDVDRRTVEFEKKQVAKIDSALQRLNDGCFGQCARCGHAIRVARLRTAPTARLCRTCEGNNSGRRLSFRGR